MSTAPKWAQALGLTTRNQALQYQARAMGFRNRGEFERERKQILELLPKRTHGVWRALLDAQTKIPVLLQEGKGSEASKEIARAHATKAELNKLLPENLKLKSPKA